MFRLQNVQKPLKTRKNGWKQPKTAKILLENGHQGVYVVENGSSQLKKDKKLLKVAGYVWKDIKKMIKRIKKGKNERKSGKSER